jgi:hypothetical protein
MNSFDYFPFSYHLFIIFVKKIINMELVWISCNIIDLGEKGPKILTLRLERGKSGNKME